MLVVFANKTYHSLLSDATLYRPGQRNVLQSNRQYVSCTFCSIPTGNFPRVFVLENVPRSFFFVYSSLHHVIFSPWFMFLLCFKNESVSSGSSDAGNHSGQTEDCNYCLCFEVHKDCFCLKYYICHFQPCSLWGHPYITYAPRGRGVCQNRYFAYGCVWWGGEGSRQMRTYASRLMLVYKLLLGIIILPY